MSEGLFFVDVFGQLQLKGFSFFQECEKQGVKNVIVLTITTTKIPSNKTLRSLMSSK